MDKKKTIQVNYACIIKYLHTCTCVIKYIANNADPEQSALLEAFWSGFSPFSLDI